MPILTNILTQRRTKMRKKLLSLLLGVAIVASFIEFKCSPMENLTPFTEKGAIICNPPYGERLGALEQH